MSSEAQHVIHVTAILVKGGTVQDVEIQEFLASLGYDSEAAWNARQALVEAGLTRPGKMRMAVNKLPKAEGELGRRFFRVCAAAPCRVEAARPGASGGRSVVTVPREWCEVCGGSENARAVREMARAMARAGKRRMLIIGGTPNVESELTRLLPRSSETRFVLDGAKRTAKDAAQEAAWADVIVVWASTPIAHKTSLLYKPFRPITVARRSISALASAVVTSLA